jgi:hypothetical protein
VEISVIDVTPALAEEWLSANDHNRNIDRRTVEMYARDMAAGVWDLNGEAVKIAEDGTLLDGQHRLAALVRAGVIVKMVVITGLTLEMQKTMDLGRRRTFAGNLQIEQVTNSPIVSSIALRGYMWDKGNVDLVAASTTPSQAEQRAWMAANPMVYRAAEIAAVTRRSFKLLAPSAVGLTYILFNRLDPGDTAEFFARLGTGAGLDEGHPILLLRNRTIRDAAESRRLTDKVRVGLLIKAWNADRTGEWPKSLQMTSEMKMPLPE